MVRTVKLIFQVQAGIGFCTLRPPGSGPETNAQTGTGRIQKAWRGLGFDRNSKIRFCRFHRVFRHLGIEAMLQGSPQLGWISTDWC